MLKGAFGLIIRYVLYAIGAGLAGAGLATMAAGTDTLCISINQVTEYVATGLSMLLGGSATFLGTAIWSRIVKRKGGVT